MTVVKVFFSAAQARRHVVKALMKEPWFKAAPVSYRRIYFAVTLAHLAHTGELPPLDEAPLVRVKLAP